MKIPCVATCLCFGLLLLPVCSAKAQITVNSVLIFGEASTTGDSSLGIADDFDAFLVNEFSVPPAAIAESSGGLLGSFASASAETSFIDNSIFGFGHFVSTTTLSPSLTANASSTVEIDFVLDSSFDLFVSSSEITMGPDPFNESTFFTNNSLQRLDGANFFDLDFSSQTLGPGNYLLRSELSRSNFADSGSTESFVSLEFTAIPEPSSLFKLSLICIASLTRRRR